MTTRDCGQRCNLSVAGLGVVVSTMWMRFLMRYLKYWAPPILYMALIFAVSSMEQPPLPMPKFEWLSIDKLYHFIEYSILSVLLTTAFVNAPPKWLPTNWMHQMFVPGRFATLSDLISDAIGAIAGVVGVYLYYRNQNKI